MEVADLLPAGGEMGRLLREQKSSLHERGPINSWPQSLRTTLGIVLSSPAAMWLGWGRDLGFFCNDACRPLIDRARDWTPGVPAREIWGALWGEFGGQVEAVFAGGKAVSGIPLGSRRRGEREGMDHVFSCGPVFDESNAIAGVLCIVTEMTTPAPGTRTLHGNVTGDATGAVNLVGITGRQDAEAALRDSEQRLRLATQIGKLGIWDWDIVTNRVSWSESLYAIHGVRPEAFDGTVEAFRALVHPADRTRVAAAIQSAFEGAAYEVEFRALRPDGTTSWLFTNGVVVRQDGQPVRMLGATMDVTERHRALEAVSEGEQRFSRFMTHLPGLAWIKDERGRYVFVNGAAARAFGFAPAELLGRTDDEIFPPETAAIFRHNDRAALAAEAGTQTVESLRHPGDGRMHHSLVSKFPIPGGEGRAPFVGGMAIDITDRQEAEIALQEAHDRLELRVSERTAQIEQANARFQAMFDQGLFAGLITPDGTLVDVNRSWLQASGFTRDQVLGRPFWDAAWWGSAPELQAWIKIGFAEAAQGEAFHGETVYHTADGGTRHMDFALMPIRNPDGAVSFIVPTGLDITDRHRAEQQLRNAEVTRETDARFRRMADSAPVLIWMADEHNAGTWFNQQWLEFVGRPLEHELDSGWLENVHRDDLEECARRCDEALAARGGFTMEFRMRRRDGEFRWMLHHGVPTIGPGGEFTGYIGSCVDITERKQAELAIQRLAAIVESSGDAILAVDLEGFVTSWNRGAELLYGYTATEIVGHPISLLIPPERADEEARFLARITRGERIEHFETQRCCKDGTTREVSLSISPIRDTTGRIVGASKIARDISERQRTEQQLERARDEAVAASRAKDDFLAALSHELRTPLNPVLLLASDASEDPTLPPEVRADFATIRKHVNLEARLIDDLLDLTRISRGKLSLEFGEHDVHAILRDALATVAGDIAEKPVVLTVRFDADAPRVRADAVRLQQVFWNVLKNAVKFTPSGGRMYVATRTPVDTAGVEITVTDTGIGMTEAELARIFDAFSQGDHAAGGEAHRFGGLGLGLAISRMVVELHGGVITASSRGPGQGASFTVRLPLAASKDRAARPSESAPSPPAGVAMAGGRILLVEDHEPTRIALERLLTRRGFAVSTAGSLAEAREQVRVTRFDLLVSDLGLPDGSGCDLMRELAGERAVRGIALTGYGMDHDVARSRSAGFSAHLTKPISAHALDRAIADVLPQGALPR